MNVARLVNSSVVGKLSLCDVTMSCAIASETSPNSRLVIFIDVLPVLQISSMLLSKLLPILLTTSRNAINESIAVFGMYLLRTRLITASSISNIVNPSSDPVCEYTASALIALVQERGVHISCVGFSGLLSFGSI